MITPLYNVAGIPVQSAVLVDSADAARSFPTGDMALSWCETCGLVFNAAFDESRVDYSVGYEVSQASSPTFLAYASRLSKIWIERFGLNGSHITEVGSGNGDFLKLICKLAQAKGTGFDVASSPAAEGEVRLTGKNLTADDTPLDTDFLVCRHTLEHVGDVSVFLSLLRAATQRNRAPVGIEVPDIRRILKEGAFWDIYYEHASYFSDIALSQAMTRAGFKVLDVRREYGDQYLVAEAVAGSAEAPTFEKDLPELIVKFGQEVPKQIAAWRNRLTNWNNSGRRVVLWGSGSKAVGFLTTIGDTSAVKCVVDVNPSRSGAYMPGLPMPIISPDELSAWDADVVIVMNPIYLEEIKADVASRNLSPDFAAITDFVEAVPA